jgi:predicted enzyme related to lactoylglutathione lyase
VHPTSVTVGIPVEDLAVATAWYDAVLDRRPAVEPADGIVEYEFAGTWIQLMGGQRSSSGWVLRYGVEDLAAERARLSRLGVSVGDVKTVPGVISFFDFVDPDDNALSCYHVLDGG